MKKYNDWTHKTLTTIEAGENDVAMFTTLLNDIRDQRIDTETHISQQLSTPIPGTTITADTKIHKNKH